ncbi:MAG: hypothetical protein FWH10_08455 [Oscillospiraceae bacterium]|nr:hypothetical protein [Oscillospiraceae bacterium]
MVYFGENNEYILCECEACKSEMYIERSTVSEEDAYSYHLYIPIKCRCGSVDEYINRSKKSCRSIKAELSDLLELLRRQQAVSNKIGEITAELNKRFVPPSFLQSIAKDFVLSLRVFLILLGSVIGVEIFLFIISALMFFFGLVFTMPDLSRAGNELFYHVNIFKNSGGSLLSRFGMAENYNPLNAELAGEQLIYDYIPYAVTGVIIMVFYAFLAVLIVRVGISVTKITFFASKVVNQKIRVNQRREEYRRQLDDSGIIYQNLSEQIGEFTILPPDYKNLRAADMILRLFINNRVDTIREAVNLFHEEDFRNRILEYEKGLYNEARQTRRYTKALYMITSDDNIKVDVRDVREESGDSDAAAVGEMLRDALAKIKKRSSQKQIPPASGSPRRKTPEESVLPDIAEIPESVNPGETGKLPEKPNETGETNKSEDVSENKGGGETEETSGILNAVFENSPEN